MRQKLLLSLTTFMNYLYLRAFTHAQCFVY